MQGNILMIRRIPSRLFPRAAVIAAASFAMVPFLQAQGFVGWGSNSDKQLTFTNGRAGLVSVAVGLRHVLGLRGDGTVYGWGYNGSGELNVPAGLSGVVQVAAGSAHSLALKSDGTVVGWGQSIHGQADPPAGLSNVVQVSAGATFSLALKADGTVVGWGWGGDGATSPPAGLNDAVQVAAGGKFSLALRANGTVAGWGSNSRGQINPPVGLENVVQIAAGDEFGLALKSDGTVVGWGNNDDNRATPPSGLNGVVQIAAGFSHAVALKEDGSVVAWGSNAFGQTNLPSLGVVKKVAAGQDVSFAFGPVNFQFQSDSVYSGEATTGFVSLPFPAGPGGVDVALAANKGDLIIPSSVHVDQDKQMATFTATAKSLPINSDVRVTATYGSGTSSQVETIIGRNPKLTLSRPDIVAGSADGVALVLTLPKAADVDKVYRIKSSDGAIQVPSTITFSAGETSEARWISHSFIGGSARTATISVFKGSELVAEAQLRVLPIELTEFTPGRIEGGEYGYDRESETIERVTYGVLRFSAPLPPNTTIKLFSNRTSVLSVPDFLRTPDSPASYGFKMQTKAVPAETVVTITVKLGAVSLTKAITVVPSANLSMSLPAVTYEYQSVRGTISTSEDGLATHKVLLSSSKPSLVLVPSGVFEATGLLQALAWVGDVEKTTSVKLAAKNGARSASGEFLVKPNVPISVKASSTKVVGGRTIAITVRVSSPTDVEMPLEVLSDSTSLKPPTEVKVLGNQVTFFVKTSRVGVEKVGHLSISRHGIGKTLTVTLTK